MRNVSFFHLADQLWDTSRPGLASLNQIDLCYFLRSHGRSELHFPDLPKYEVPERFRCAESSSWKVKSARKQDIRDAIRGLQSQHRPQWNASVSLIPRSPAIAHPLLANLDLAAIRSGLLGSGQPLLKRPKPPWKISCSCWRQLLPRKSALSTYAWGCSTLKGSSFPTCLWSDLICQIIFIMSSSPLRQNSSEEIFTSHWLLESSVTYIFFAQILFSTQLYSIFQLEGYVAEAPLLSEHLVYLDVDASKCQDCRHRVAFLNSCSDRKWAIPCSLFGGGVQRRRRSCFTSKWKVARSSSKRIMNVDICKGRQGMDIFYLQP